MIAKVIKRTELGPLVALPTARHAGLKRGNRLSPVQSAQLCLDCRRRSSSRGHPQLVPLFNESGKSVPTSRRRGHPKSQGIASQGAAPLLAWGPLVSADCSRACRTCSAARRLIARCRHDRSLRRVSEPRCGNARGTVPLCASEAWVPRQVRGVAKLASTPGALDEGDGRTGQTFGT